MFPFPAYIASLSGLYNMSGLNIDFGSINYGSIAYARRHNRRGKIIRRYR